MIIPKPLSANEAIKMLRLISPIDILISFLIVMQVTEELVKLAPFYGYFFRRIR